MSRQPRKIDSISRRRDNQLAPAGLVIVGVTGGIGTGKSVTCRMFQELGRTVIFADRIARDLTDASEGIKSGIRQAFGEEMYAPSGRLDRKRLASIVFKDKHARLRLNAIVHPHVFHELDRLIERLSMKRRTPFVLVEAALIFETGMDEHLSHTIVVNADRENAIARVMKRDSCDRQDVLDRMNSQMPMEEKLKLADFVIHNDGTEQELKEKVTFLNSIIGMMSHTTKK